MPLFGRRRGSQWISPGQVQGPATGFAVSYGWEPVLGPPFGGILEDGVHEATRVMYGVPRYQEHQTGIGNTTFTDVLRGSVDGRAVTVANARTVIEPGLFQGGQGTPVVAVCAVELPTVLPFGWIQPRRYPSREYEAGSPTGNPVFDERYEVTGGTRIEEALTPDVQQRIMARDDWIFHAKSNLLGCVTKGAFGSPDEVNARVGELMGVVAAFPVWVMPAHVGHSADEADELVARLGRISSIDDAIAMLQQLTPRDREQLARSGTPLAAFADVRTPEQAMARFQSLDMQQRMQIMTMFMREDG